MSMGKYTKSVRQPRRFQCSAKKSTKKPDPTFDSELSESSSGLGPQIKGRIVAQYGTNLDIEDEQGNRHHCVSRRNLPKLVCGDYILWQTDNRNNNVITQLLPRTSLLSRPGINKQLRPIASNIDQILIVISISPMYDEDLINRYLVASRLTHITAAIIVNKVDLLDEKSAEELTQTLKPYRDIGYEIVYASTKERSGLNSLTNKLRGKTSIFVGQSGVGKSSLINTLIPNLDIRVGELSEATGLGKHTTTVSILYRLDSDGYLIDSPGIREFGLGHLPAKEIATGFVEFAELARQCKFNDCTHFNEPECAVIDAVQKGEVYLRRYESYKRIVETLGKR